MASTSSAGVSTPRQQRRHQQTERACHRAQTAEQACQPPVVAAREIVCADAEREEQRLGHQRRKHIAGREQHQKEHGFSGGGAVFLLLHPAIQHPRPDEQREVGDQQPAEVMTAIAERPPGDARKPRIQREERVVDIADRIGGGLIAVLGDVVIPARIPRAPNIQPRLPGADAEVRLHIADPLRALKSRPRKHPHRRQHHPRHQPHRPHPNPSRPPIPTLPAKAT